MTTNASLAATAAGAGATKRSTALLVMMLATTVAWALLNAYEAPVWYDEFFTIYVGRLPTLADIGRSLAHALDTNPPTFVLIGRAFHGLIADEQLAYRLPSLAGFVGVLLCTYAIVAHRTDCISALVSTAFVMCAPFARAIPVVCCRC